jgi:DNA polymerase elongation subunit (family B)
MNVEIIEIKAFLKSKKGYLKEGSKRLKSHLLKRGMVATVGQCKTALREARSEQSSYKIDSPGTSLPKVLIYDIETSYNIVKSWRVGYNLNINPSDILHERSIICVSYKWLGEEEVYNIEWDSNQCDKSLLETMIPVLNEADMIVAHNGDRYDLKFIKTRALKHGLPMLVDYPQFDTLKVAKKKFMFNSNKLDYITEFLGFGNKIKTSMKLWDDIILKRCPEAMEKMVEYCDMDVILLEKVYNKLVSWENPRLHAGVLSGLHKQTSPISGGTNLRLVKTVSTAGGTKKRIMEDLDTKRIFPMSDTNYKKFLEIK